MIHNGVDAVGSKFIDIDDRKRLIRRGDRVLDAGAAPGSWTQVAAQRVGPKGEVVAVDLKQINGGGYPPNVRLIQADLRDGVRSEIEIKKASPARSARTT